MRFSAFWTCTIDILNAHRYDSACISISLDQRSCSWLHIHLALPFIEDLMNVQHKILKDPESRTVSTIERVPVGEKGLWIH